MGLGERLNAIDDRVFGKGRAARMRALTSHATVVVSRTRLLSLLSYLVLAWSIFCGEFVSAETNASMNHGVLTERTMSWIPFGLAGFGAIYLLPRFVGRRGVGVIVAIGLLGGFLTSSIAGPWHSLLYVVTPLVGISWIHWLIREPLETPSSAGRLDT